MPIAMETPQNYQDILARVNDFNTTVKEAKAKEAGATKVPEDDPRNKGEKGVPDLNETDDTNKTKNEGSNEDSKLEDESTHPVSTGKNVPSTQDGNAKEDAFTEPTTPLSKIATIEERANAVKARIAGFRKGASATTTSAAPATPSKPAKTQPKEANTELAGDYSDEFLRKLAFAVCETEGGLEAVEPILLKYAGQEEARELMSKAAAEYDQLVQLSHAMQQEEMEKLAYEAESLQAAEEMLKNASAEEREQIIKVANIHNKNTAEYADDLLKMAYMAGAGDAASMMDAEAMPPEEGGGEEAGLPGAAQGEPSIEEIVQLLDAMVASGEIDEQTAAQVVEQLAGAGGGGEEAAMMGGGEEAAMMGGGEMPPGAEEAAMMGGGEMPPEEGMVAQANTNKGKSLPKNASADDLCKALITQPA